MPVPADIYKSELDFTALALTYPSFAQKLKPNKQVDFSDPESIRQLTQALLNRDFDLKIALPDNRLCPTVPNRFNYIVFLQRLIDSTPENYDSIIDPHRRVIGIDIGTGASAIYPLLGCRQRVEWHFLATEIDNDSRCSALDNVRTNGLESRINVIAAEEGTLLPLAEIDKLESIDFTMTNPPFYASQSELETLAQQKSRPPNSACTGAPIEMIYPGGEVSFISRLLYESTLPHVKHKIKWFTSMLGRLGSVNIIIEKLKDYDCTNFAVTEFVQGQKTRRWCIAWSWHGLRPLQDVARGTRAVEKKYLPFPVEIDIQVKDSIEVVAERLRDEFSKLFGSEWSWYPTLSQGLFQSLSGDVWSRSARRKRKRPDNHDGDVDMLEDIRARPRIVVSTSYHTIPTREESSEGGILRLRWLEGQDHVLFESFYGWLKRKLS